MYAEAEHPYDADYIRIDIENRTASFEYLKKPTFINYFTQANIVTTLTPLLLIYPAPMLYSAILAFFDYKFNTKTIHTLTKHCMDFYLKYAARKDYVIASKLNEKIKASIQLGFEWESTGEHRQYLKEVIFSHYRVIPQLNYELRFLDRKFKIPTKTQKGEIKFIFSQVPKTGHISVRYF